MSLDPCFRRPCVAALAVVIAAAVGSPASLAAVDRLQLTIGKDPSMSWRAIDSNTLHNIFYWIIIVWQIVAAIGCWIGVWRLYRARKEGVIGFQSAKSAAIFGLAIVIVCTE